MSSARAKTLPYDVWVHIFALIPPETLQGLYAVNRDFFDAALSERYRVVGLVHPDNPFTKRCLERLLDDKLRSSKARTLRLQLASLGSIIREPEHFDWKAKLQGGVENVYLRPPGSKRRLFRKGDNGKKSSQSLDYLHSLVRMVVGLTNVQEFIVEYHPDEDSLRKFNVAIPFVLAGWEAFGAHLRTLNLAVPIETLEDILLTDLSIPHLETLEVQIFLVYRTTDPLPILDSVLAPFINAHRQTLRCISIQTHQHLHLTPMLKALQHFPLLRSFTIVQGFVSTLQTDTSGLHQFLSQHSTQLTTFRVFFHALATKLTIDPLMAHWFAQPFLHVPLPSLSRLDLGLIDFPTTFPERLRDSYLQQYWTYISHLGLRMQLAVADIDTVLSNIPADNVIRSLHVNVVLLTPELLDVLSARLPNLHELEIGADNFGVIDDETSSDRHKAFSDALSTRSYPNWKLRHLVITGVWSYVLPTPLVCFRAILYSMPGLETFNRSSRQETLREVE
ncbi:hypothetical protein FA15DRAFT_753881 [Coprinopsis marcescibilis]|uniref:F-box domain-containing protein n=1 Tax=Coprinopsis marcescibilis TaxID=230819 RepID=A0A5C3LH61_COPMA|nr:hypothetical protein FA15DRAFT_753881 [Coprinopsis marcescibilis]